MIPDTQCSVTVFANWFPSTNVDTHPITHLCLCCISREVLLAWDLVPSPPNY